MSEVKTYLELSEDSAVSHKFYEVTIKDCEVTIRYGRIGTAGTVKTSVYPTPEKAQAEASKKVNQKLKKGYEHSIMGVRKKRQITRRQVNSSKSKAKQAPILWKFASGSSAFGIFIDANRSWVGNQTGQVFALDPEGQVLNQYQLPDGVKCLVADEDWIYAGCDNGKVYDLTGKIPRIAYEIDENVDIYWLDIYDGLLGVADANGGVTTIDHEEQSQWTRLSQGKAGWMVRCDRQGVYHGHSGGVTKYDTVEGRMLWHQATRGSVLFGWQEANTVYAGTSDRKVYSFSKDGTAGTVYQCDSSVYSCATADDGKYVFAGDDSSSIYCFNQSGERLWKLGTGCDSAFSMQYLCDRLYIVTTSGYLTCIDVGEQAINDAQGGNVPNVLALKAPNTPGIAPSDSLETTSDQSQGVIVKCVREGEHLRIRVVSPGYNPDWNVQFPKNIREDGATYTVEEIKESARGGFYRTFGEIKKLI